MAYVLANGIRVHVQRLNGQRGEGADAFPVVPSPPPVVFIHGLAVDNLSSYYYSLANPVARVGAEAILYDLRGHGLSERPPDGYTVADAVADLVGVLDALGVDRPAHLVGNSYGGVVALRAALDVPERVRSLVLIEAHCADDETEGSDWAELMADTLTATALSLEHDRLPAQLLAVGDRKLARMARTADRDAPVRLRGAGPGRPPQSRRRRRAGAGPPGSPDRLGGPPGARRAAPGAGRPALPCRG